MISCAMWMATNISPYRTRSLLIKSIWWKCKPTVKLFVLPSMTFVLCVYCTWCHWPPVFILLQSHTVHSCKCQGKIHLQFAICETVAYTLTTNNIFHYCPVLLNILFISLCTVFTWWPWAHGRGWKYEGILEKTHILVHFYQMGQTDLFS